MMTALAWAPEGDERDGVAGRDSAADGLHIAAIQEVDHGFPAITGMVVEQTLELRRARRRSGVRRGCN